MIERVRKILWVVAILFAVCFVAVGCQQFYRSLGFIDEQAKSLADRNRAKGEDAMKQSQDTFWQWFSMAVTGVGALVSGTLAKLLDREKTTVKAIITGVENGGDGKVKENIKLAATTLGVEKHLSKVVNKLTG